MPEPANLRFLRRMVTLLMVTMIVGIAVIAGALVLGIVGERAGGTAMTEIRVGPGYTVRSVDHGAGDRLVLVLEEAATGETVVRIYRTEGAAEAYRVVE